MILSTPQMEYAGQTPSLYAPLDPKYLYPIKPIPTDGYLTQGYLEAHESSSGTSLDDLMNQKRDVIHSKIGMVLSEITQRYELKNQNLSDICRDQCTFRNLINLMGDIYLDRNRIELEGKILDLEQEKRREKAGYFRDILFLRKELRESLVEKLEEEQKALFFADPVEELSWNP